MISRLHGSDGQQSSCLRRAYCWPDRGADRPGTGRPRAGQAGPGERHDPPRTADDCVVVSTVTSARRSDRIQRTPSARMTAASSASRAKAVRRGRPTRPGWRGRRAAAQPPPPSGEAEVPSSCPPRQARMSRTEQRRQGEHRDDKRTAAKSLPGADRSSPARLTVNSRASVMQNSTSSTTATRA